MSALLDLLPKTSPLRIMEIVLEQGQISRVETPCDGVTLVSELVSEEPIILKLKNNKRYLYPSEFYVWGRGQNEKEAVENLANDYFSKLRKLISAAPMPFMGFDKISLIQCIRKDITFESFIDHIYGEGVFAEAIIALLMLDPDYSKEVV